MLDEYAQEIIDKNPNMMIPWYLIAAYAYYVQDDPITSDKFFDQLAVDLAFSWNFVEHRHKEVITLDMLKAGTFIGDYPSIVEGAVEVLREKL